MAVAFLAMISIIGIVVGCAIVFDVIVNECECVECDMRSEWDKCYFCIYYDDYEGCDGFGCDFELSEDKVIEKAKEKEISCTDVLALIRGLERNG